MTKTNDLFGMIECKQAGVITTSTSYSVVDLNLPWDPIRFILQVFNFDHYSLSGIPFLDFGYILILCF